MTPVHDEYQCWRIKSSYDNGTLRIGRMIGYKGRGLPWVWYGMLLGVKRSKGIGVMMGGRIKKALRARRLELQDNYKLKAKLGGIGFSFRLSILFGFLCDLEVGNTIK